MRLLLLLVIAAICAATSFATASILGQAPNKLAGFDAPPFNATQVFGWVNVDYDWEGSPWKDRQAAVDAGALIPENNVATGLAYVRGKYFICVPRWRPGVPSTLNEVVVDPKNKSRHILKPWPSWTHNREVFGYVQAVWVNADMTKMYVIDTGRQNFFGGDPSIIVNTSAKLHVYDVTIPDLPVETYFYEFPSDIFHYDSSFLNDIVVDPVRDIAYMTDTNVNPYDGALVTHNLKTGFSRRFVDLSTQANMSYVVTVNDVAYPTVHNPVDGIGLTSNGEALFYSAVDGDALYTLNALVFSNASASHDDVAFTVQRALTKPSNSDGMRVISVKDAAGNVSEIIFYGGIGQDTLYYSAIAFGADGAVSLGPSIPTVSNFTTMQWFDSYATIPTSADGTCPILLFTTNRLQLYFFFTMPWDGKDGDNMRLFAMATC